MKAPIRLLEASNLPSELALALRGAPTPTAGELHAVGGQVGLALGLGSALHRATTLRVVESAGEAGTGAAGALQATPGVMQVVAAKAAVVVGACVLGGAVLGAGLSGLSVYLFERSGDPAPMMPKARTVGDGRVPSAPTTGLVAPPAMVPSAAEAASSPRQQTRPAPSVAQPEADPSDDEPELSLLGRARKALPTTPSEALALCELHRQHYDRGVLAQEREVIALDAELRLGQSSAARARAARFRTSYPGSAHLRRVEALLAAAAATSP